MIEYLHACVQSRSLGGGGGGGSKLVSVCKVCGKLGESGGVLPWEILILYISIFY